jgi:phage terminase small subunit
MFDIHLLRSLPRPRRSVLFRVLTFAALVALHWSGLPNTTLTKAKNLSGDFYVFLCDERSERPKHPQILIAGSSLCSMGFYIDELEKRTGMSAAKIALGGARATDMLNILECFPDETQYANILFLELAPERLSYEDEKTRKQFFDEMHGAENFDLPSWLGRFSMSYFACYVKEMTRRKDQVHQPLADHSFERNWNEPKYAADHVKKHPSLQRRAERVRHNRENSITEDVPLLIRVDSNHKEILREKHYETSQIEAVYRLVDLCRRRNIFVVICVTPNWYGVCNFTQQDIEEPTDNPYLSLLQKLNERHDCTVIICRDFEEITREGSDEDYLFDYGHMTRQGAIVYTNWLVDRLMATPKLAERFQEHNVIR